MPTTPLEATWIAFQGPSQGPHGGVMVVALPSLGAIYLVYNERCNAHKQSAKARWCPQLKRAVRPLTREFGTS